MRKKQNTFLKGLKQFILGVIGGMIIITVVFIAIFYGNEISTQFFQFSLAEQLSSFFISVFGVLAIIRIYQRINVLIKASRKEKHENAIDNIK